MDQIQLTALRMLENLLLRHDSFEKTGHWSTGARFPLQWLTFLLNVVSIKFTFKLSLLTNTISKHKK